MTKRRQNTEPTSIKPLLSVLCVIILFTACDNIFTKVKGKEAELQGKWRMESVDTIFFNFQNKLFQYQIYNHQDDRFDYTFGYYQLLDDTAINIEIQLNNNIYIPFDELKWDTVPDLKETYKNKIFKQFEIKTITNKKLILSTEGHELSFHKF
jgi:hypothetical protein